MQLTSQLAGARKQAVRLQAEAEAAHEAQRSVVGAKQSELMQAQLKLSETEQLAELYRQALTSLTSLIDPWVPPPTPFGVPPLCCRPEGG